MSLAAFVKKTVTLSQLLHDPKDDRKILLNEHLLRGQEESL